MKKLNTSSVLMLSAYLVALIILSGCERDTLKPEKSNLTITTLISDLQGVMSIETDAEGNVWISENDLPFSDQNQMLDDRKDYGKVSVITSDGKKHDAIVHLPSSIDIPSVGLTRTINLLRDKEMMYILTENLLYRVDISSFSPGDAPLDARLLSSENIRTYMAEVFSLDNSERVSQPYDMTLGPEGDLYIVDAGANAIIHRKGVNDYSFLTFFPDRFNPYPLNSSSKIVHPELIPDPTIRFMGGPIIQAVPTSIIFDGKNFLVTSFTSMPFLTGKAMIYSVTMAGNIEMYGGGFDMLMDIDYEKESDPLVVQFASSYHPDTGYAPRTGALLRVNGSEITSVARGLNQPVSIKRVNENTWYVVSSGDGAVLKISYEE